MKKIILIIALLFAFNVHSQNQVGMLTTNLDDIQELKAFSNSFAYSSKNVNDIRVGLDINNNAMRPNFDLTPLFFNKQNGLFSINSNVYHIINAINESVHNREIGLFFDEPLWHLRMSCHIEQKQRACDEIENDYQQTFSVMKQIVDAIKDGISHQVHTAHIESFAELVIQKTNNPGRLVLMANHVDSIGWDCYGSIEACGIDGYHLPGFGEIGLHHQELYYNEIEDIAIQNGQSIILVPGIFVDGVKFETVQDTIDQFDIYLSVFDNKPIVSGFFGFIYNNLQVGNDYWIGMRSHVELYDYVSHEMKLRR